MRAGKKTSVEPHNSQALEGSPSSVLPKGAREGGRAWPGHLIGIQTFPGCVCAGSRRREVDTDGEGLTEEATHNLEGRLGQRKEVEEKTVHEDRCRA